jgi:hypothetical protein
VTLLLECSLRAGLIAATVAAVIHALRITHARHAAWCGVLAAMLLAPWIPKATLRVLPAITPAPDLPLYTPAPTVIPTSRAAPLPAPIPLEHAGWRPDPLLTMYLAVAAFLLIRLLLGTARAVTLLRRATPEEGLLSSAECACPVTIGWLCPAVVLPLSWRRWPRAELDAVFAHEREQARRRDPLVQWFAALNRCVSWFHPLAWKRPAILPRSHAVMIPAITPSTSCTRPVPFKAPARVWRSRAPPWSTATSSLASSVSSIPALPQRPAAPAPSLEPRCASHPSPPFAGCQLGGVERAAPGRPTMNDLMHRRADKNKEMQAKQEGILGPRESDDIRRS